jgi:O-antigen/teichoic acid export membrane protein
MEPDVTATVEERTAGEQSRRDLATVARGGTLNLVGLVGAALFNAALVIVVAHTLGARDRGLFFEAVAFFNIVSSVTVWGGDVGIVRQIPRLRVLERAVDVRPTVKLVLVSVFVVGLLCAIVVEMWAEPLAGVLVRDGSPERLATLLRLLAPFLPIASAYVVTVAATRGFGTMRVYALVDRLGLSLAQPIFVLAVVLTGFGLVAVTFAWVAPTLVTATIAGVWLARLMHRGDASVADDATPTPIGRLFAEFWRFAAPRGLAGVFAVTILWLDTLLLGALRSADEAGIYAAATRYLVIGQFAALAITQVVGPKLSEVLSANQHDRAEEIYRTGTAWSIALAWPVYWTMIVFAPVLLSVFGPGFGVAQHALLILGASMLVASATGPVDVVLLMGGRSTWNLFNTVVAVVANVGLNLLLIPRFGVTGAAIAWAASILANNVLPMIEVWLLFRLHPFGSATRIVGAMATGCFGVVPLLARLAFGASLESFLIGEAVGGLLYLLLLRVLRERLQLPLLFASLRARGRPAAAPPEPAT